MQALGFTLQAAGKLLLVRACVGRGRSRNEVLREVIVNFLSAIGHLLRTVMGGAGRDRPLPSLKHDSAPPIIKPRLGPSHH
jgi:hypothetical protein